MDNKNGFNLDKDTTYIIGKKSKYTGGTDSARYCYSVWL